MVKSGALIGVAVVAVVAFIAYELLKGGSGTLAAASSSEATGAQTLNPNAYNEAAGQGSLAITEIYSPAYRYDLQQSYTSSTSTTVSPKVGLFNF